MFKSEKKIKDYSWLYILLNTWICRKKLCVIHMCVWYICTYVYEFNGQIYIINYSV